MRFIFTIHQIIAYSAKKDRALSSGCVRVEKSDQLASILLQEAGWSEDKNVTFLESKKTTSANIRTNDPVFLYYVTAWVENGQNTSFTRQFINTMMQQVLAVLIGRL